MLRFSLCWTHGPPKHRLCSEFDTALDLQKIREGNYHWILIAVLLIVLGKCPWVLEHDELFWPA